MVDNLLIFSPMVAAPVHPHPFKISTSQDTFVPLCKSKQKRVDFTILDFWTDLKIDNCSRGNKQNNNGHDDTNYNRCRFDFLIILLHLEGNGMLFPFLGMMLIAK